MKSLASSIGVPGPDSGANFLRLLLTARGEGLFAAERSADYGGFFRYDS